MIRAISALSAICALSLLSAFLPAQAIRGYRDIGSLPGGERPSGFACVPVKGGHALLFLCDGGIRWTARLAGESSIGAPQALDLSAFGLARARDMRAFHRFGGRWTVFFAGADAQGNESLFSLDFSADDPPGLVPERYECSGGPDEDEHALAGPIGGYRVLRGASEAVYAIIQKNHRLYVVAKDLSSSGSTPSFDAAFPAFPGIDVDDLSRVFVQALSASRISCLLMATSLPLPGGGSRLSMNVYQANMPLYPPGSQELGFSPDRFGLYAITGLAEGSGPSFIAAMGGQGLHTFFEDNRSYFSVEYGEAFPRIHSPLFSSRVSTGLPDLWLESSGDSIRLRRMDDATPWELGAQASIDGVLQFIGVKSPGANVLYYALTATGLSGDAATYLLSFDTPGTILQPAFSKAVLLPLVLPRPALFRYRESNVLVSAVESGYSAYSVDSGTVRSAVLGERPPSPPGILVIDGKCHSRTPDPGSMRSGVEAPVDSLLAFEGASAFYRSNLIVELDRVDEMEAFLANDVAPSRIYLREGDRP
jgi:hypothetical protein